MASPPLAMRIGGSVYAVYEHHQQGSARRGPHLHTGYDRPGPSVRHPHWSEGLAAVILFQLLRLLGVPVLQEEFHSTKTLDIAIANDAVWAKICHDMGWKFNPAV